MLAKIHLGLTILTLVVVVFILIGPRKYHGGIALTMTETYDKIETLESLLLLQDSLSKHVVQPNITKIENHYRYINSIKPITDPDSLVQSTNELLR